MSFREERMNLFDVDESWHLAHCVASDLAMGAGIAVPMNAKFDLRRKIRESGEDLRHPTCVLVDGVFNMITKARSFQKPTVEDFLSSLRLMRDMAVNRGVAKLAMPRIGCGLDGLPWPAVRDAIRKEFFETDVEVLVCVK